MNDKALICINLLASQFEMFSVHPVLKLWNAIILYVKGKRFCETYILYYHIYCVYQGKTRRTPNPEAGKPPLPQSPKIPAGRIETHHNLSLSWKLT